MRIIFVPISLSGYLMNSASERFRCRWLALYLSADIYDRTQDLDNYDVIIYNKGFYPQEFRALARRYQDKLQILDSTEPDWLFYSEEFEEMASYCHILTGSTPELAEEMKQFGDSYCIPDRQNLDFYKIKKIHTNVAFPKLIWYGYIENFKRIESLIPYIEKKELSLLAISNRPPKYGHFKKWSLETSNEDIISGDIVLNPLCKYKSNNKTTTAWALGMPVATNEREIEKFLDYKERGNEAERRLKEVKEKWDIKISAEELKNLIGRYM